MPLHFNIRPTITQYCQLQDGSLVPSPESIILTTLSCHRKSELSDMELTKHIANALTNIMHANNLEIKETAAKLLFTNSEHGNSLKAHKVSEETLRELREQSHSFDIELRSFFSKIQKLLL